MFTFENLSILLGTFAMTALVWGPPLLAGFLYHYFSEEKNRYAAKRKFSIAKFWARAAAGLLFICLVYPLVAIHYFVMYKVFRKSKKTSIKLHFWVLEVAGKIANLNLSMSPPWNQLKKKYLLEWCV